MEMDPFAQVGFVSNGPLRVERMLRTRRPCVCMSDKMGRPDVSRRQLGQAALGAGLALWIVEDPAHALSEIEPMPGLKGKDYGKSRMEYKDFTRTESGLQYKDARIGKGDVPKEGDRVVIDWEGYTIGYYGRIFEARNKAQGGAFTGEDKDFYRFVVGDGSVIPALDEGVRGMLVGGVRQLVIPAEIGYPEKERANGKIGPKPRTFSGQRALDFVLANKGLIDKTLLINVELMRIDRRS